MGATLSRPDAEPVPAASAGEANRRWSRALRVGAGIALAFGASVTLIGLLVGVLPVVPSERVSYALGVSAALPILAAVMAYAATQLVKGLASRDTDPDLRWHLTVDVGFLALFVVVTYFHFNLKMWSPLVNPRLHDAAYFATDGWVRWLVDGCIGLSAMIRQVLGPEIRWYQGMFILLFIVGLCYFTVTRHRLYGHFVVAVLLVLSVGGFSYLVAPAVGPFIYEEGASALTAEGQAGMYAAFQQLQRQGPAWIHEWGPGYFTSALAAMPSLHIAHAGVMTWYMLASRSVLAGFFVVATAWIAVDAVGLRWHYVIDLPFGLALAGVVVWLTNRLLGHEPKADETEPDPPMP